MYVCQVTGKQSKPGEGCNKVTIATRERVYTRWIRNDDKAEGISRELILGESADRKWLEVFVGRGWEIVREINASQEGVQLWNSWSPEEREVFVKHLDN
jgi:hypothetical protein